MKQQSLKEAGIVEREPCVRCPQYAKGCGNRCTEWREWFAWTWREIQIAYGADPKNIKSREDILEDIIDMRPGKRKKGGK